MNLVKSLALALALTAGSATFAAIPPTTQEKAPRSEMKQENQQMAQALGYICRSGPYWCTLNLTGPMPLGTSCYCNLGWTTFWGFVTTN